MTYKVLAKLTYICSVYFTEDSFNSIQVQKSRTEPKRCLVSGKLKRLLLKPDVALSLFENGKDGIK